MRSNLRTGPGLAIGLIVWWLALGAHAATPQEAPAAEPAAPTLEQQKLLAERDKLLAEAESLRALRPFSREATAWLAAAGTIAGGALGALITFVFNRMGRQRLQQERELAREQHNLQLFQSLEEHSLAAASILSNRLKRLARLERKAHLGDLEEDELPAIKKVLVSTLKKQQGARRVRKDAGSASGGETAAQEDLRDGSVLRKFVAEELVDALLARFPKDKRPAKGVPSPLGAGLEFQQCDIKEVYWALVNLRGLDFYGSDLSGASLSGAALEKSVFYNAVMVETVLQKADLTEAILTGANLQGANLRGAVLAGADLSGADLRGADLGDADLSGATLSGVIYNTARSAGRHPTRWPADFDPAGRGIAAREVNDAPAPAG